MKVVNPLVERCFELVELLSEDARWMRLGDIAARLSIHKSAAHRLLTSLCNTGWIEQHPETGFYRLTLRLAITGRRFLIGTGIPDICQPVLDGLARESRELVRMAIVEGGELTWVAQAQGAKSGLIYQPATNPKVPLHVTANGKAWLASLSIEEAIKIALKAGFGAAGQFGPNAISSVDALMKELDVTRKRGWALANEEAEAGVAAIAAAICPSGGAAVGTVSVAGPILRLTKQRTPEIVRQVMTAAEDLAVLWPLREPDSDTEYRSLISLGSSRVP